MLHNPRFNGAKIKTFRLADILVPDFQRPLRLVWVDYLADNWYAPLFTYPVIAVIDGLPYVIDGNHTRAALLKLGETHVPCRVFENLTYEEAAKLFSDLNTQRKLPDPYNLYVSDLAGGREWAVILRDIVAKHGLRIAASSSAHGIGCVAAIRERCFRDRFKPIPDRIATFDEALAVITETYSVGSAGASSRCERPIVVGMMDFLTRLRAHDGYQRAKVVRKLKAARFSRLGLTFEVNPKTMGDYVKYLVETGVTEIPTSMNTGTGQAKIYGKAFAVAVLGSNHAKALYSPKIVNVLD